jgi:hypothetical protein
MATVKNSLWELCRSAPDSPFDPTATSDVERVVLACRNGTDRLCDVGLVKLAFSIGLSSGGGIKLAPYAEPTDDVVAETDPDCFHRGFRASSTSELP